MKGLPSVHSQTPSVIRSFRPNQKISAPICVLTHN